MIFSSTSRHQFSAEKKSLKAHKSENFASPNEAFAVFSKTFFWSSMVFPISRGRASQNVHEKFHIVMHEASSWSTVNAAFETRVLLTLGGFYGGLLFKFERDSRILTSFVFLYDILLMKFPPS